MKSTDAQPPYETLEIGTPLDYTSDMYKVYLEVREHDGLVLKILTEVVRLLSQNNIGVYQVVRYAKTNSTGV